MDRGIVDRLLKEAEKPKVGALWQAFSHEAKRAKDSGDEETALMLRALSDASNMMLASGDPVRPFRPFATFDNGTTATPQSLSEADFAVIKAFSDEATDPELRARCADLLWVAKRDREAAQRAIIAYIESATRLNDPSHWVEPMKRIERAYRLATQLRDEGLLKMTSDYVKNLLKDHDGKDPLYFTTNLLELLAEHKDGDAAQFATLAEAAAGHAESQKDYRRARGLWTLASRWHGLNKDDSAKDDAALAAARTYLCEADERAAQSDSLVEAAHLSSALTALKRARADPAEIEATHKRLLKVQNDSVKAMTGIGGSVDLTENARAARDAVKGRAFADALQRLAFIHAVTDAPGLRKEVEAIAKDYPLQFLFEQTVVNNVGKVVARIPSILSTTGDEREDALFSHMVKNAVWRQSMVAIGLVMPARSVISQEHPIEPRDILPLVRNNPVVPPGREGVYARGIYEGLTGDLEVSLHLLAPQLENSIRFVMETRGVAVTRHDDKGIQQEIAIHRLMDSDEFDSIFGEDLAFDLRSLFVHPVGPNFRNRVAHGLAPSRDLRSSSALYAWWIALRLLFVGWLATNEVEPPTPDEVEVPDENIREVDLSENDAEK